MEKPTGEEEGTSDAVATDNEHDEESQHPADASTNTDDANVTTATTTTAAAEEEEEERVEDNGDKDISTNMKDKVCVVTGANTGIGFEIALGLAAQGARVVMVCRDLYKGQEAMEQVMNEYPDSPVDLVIGDLGSLSKTRSLADELCSEYEAIDVLIHNAGIWPTVLNRNEDGLEDAFCVNHLSPFFLTHLLLEKLKKDSTPTAMARVVFVSAGLAVYGKVDLASTPYGMDFSRMTTYRNTKLCSILTLPKWAELLEGTNVTLNMVHPGVVRTNLGASSGFLGWALRQVKKTWKTPKEGAEAPVWLATSEEVEGKSGMYFNEKSEMDLPANCTDPLMVKELWNMTMQLAGMEVEEGETELPVAEEDGDDCHDTNETDAHVESKEQDEEKPETVS